MIQKVKYKIVNKKPVILSVEEMEERAVGFPIIDSLPDEEYELEEEYD